MKLNTAVSRPAIRTHEGAVAKRITPLQELRRTVCACLLWEDTFYESGQSVADRIVALVAVVSPDDVAALAVEAREQMKLRHVPLLLVRELARRRVNVEAVLSRIIQRPDELAEFIALYWKDGKEPLSASVKRGLANAFTKFNAYSLAKYDRDGAVKLRDVLFLSHAKPKDEEQAAAWKQLVEGTLAAPDTWEVALSAGADKGATFTRLIGEGKLGALALLRNLRNMQRVGVGDAVIRQALRTCDPERVLPFRFVSAAKYAPKFEPELEALMFKCLEGRPKLTGKTVLVVDVSGSMYGSPVSARSEVDRAGAACALAMLARESCEDVAIYATAGNDRTRVHATQLVPARRGFALRDVIYNLTGPLGGGGIFLTPVMRWIREREEHATRTIIISDEQDCAVAAADSPNHAPTLGESYMVNVATYKNGIGYGAWTHIDGWSESVLDFIATHEGPGESTQD